MKKELTGEEFLGLCKEVSSLMMDSAKPKLFEIQDKFGVENVPDIIFSVLTGILSASIIESNSVLKERIHLSLKITENILATIIDVSSENLPEGVYGEQT